jgi:hypothetical protein
MRRVSYHQSVFDLVDIQPQESPQAREMIEAHEARSGRLPEAVRQWYLTEGVVPLREENAADQVGHLWYDYSNMDHPEPLDFALRQFARELPEGNPRWGADRLLVLEENQGCWNWFVQLDGSDDPPVLVDRHYAEGPDGRWQELEWVRVAGHFSDFLFGWIADYYVRDWTPLSERDPYEVNRIRPPREKPYLNGLWLYAPHAEPLAPPQLDFLIEQFNEVYRRQLGHGAMQYGFSHADGTIRVTTDDPEPGGVSAWWLHADSAEHLYRLAERVLWCGNLREALRHRTEAAGTVMDRLH